MDNKLQNYIDGISSGEIVCGNLVKLAVERFQRDLKNEQSFYFDELAAKRTVTILHTNAHGCRESFPFRF